MCIKTAELQYCIEKKKEKKSTVNCITKTEKWPKLRATNQKKSKTMKIRCNINCTTHRNVIYLNTQTKTFTTFDIKVHTETLKL